MKKKYSTPNLIKAVSFSAAMATLLSSVSPVFAANLAIVGGTSQSTPGPNVVYPYGSHGSVVLSGDDDYCGVDNVIGRGGKQQEGSADKITAEEQYNRFINDQAFQNRYPYGTTTEKEAWVSEGITNGSGGSGGYMSAFTTGGTANAMPEAYGVYSFATGCGSSAIGNYSTAFGAGATAKAGGAQAFGVSALAAGKASVAMGMGSEASGESTVAIGGLATASGKNSVTLGTKTKAEKNYAIAIGSEAEALGSGSIAIGSRDSDRTPEASRKVTAKGENAIAIGTHTYAETEDSVAIGANAHVIVVDGVAVGGGSVSDREKGDFGYDPYLNGPTTDSRIAWKSTAGAFSIGEVDGKDGQSQLTRQITGVAAGSKDTDAVNVAQLKAMRDVIAGGGGWKLSANDTDLTDVNPGNIIDFSTSNTNLTIAKNTAENKHKIQFTLSDTLELTRVTTGTTIMSNDGFMFVDGNGPKMSVDGISAGNKKITGVADGETDADAVNYAQLKAVKDAAQTSWKLSVNSGNTTTVGRDDTLNLQSDGEEGNKNIKITKDDNYNVIFDLADNIKVTSVTSGRSVMSDDGFLFTGGGPRITFEGIEAGNKRIAKVAAGEEDSDAVNFAQLNEVKGLISKAGSWILSVNGKGATTVGPNDVVNLQSAGDEDNQNIHITKNDDNTVEFGLADDIQVMTVTTGESVMSAVGFGFEGGNGPSITVNGIHAGDKTIKGVAAGEEDTDAVNYKQLKDVKTLAEQGWKLSVDGNNATDVKAGNTVDIVAGASEDGSKNIKIEKDNNKVTFSLNDNLKLTSVTTGRSIMSDDGFGFEGNKGPRIAFDGIDAGNEKITKVAQAEDDTDAVNYKQLKDFTAGMATGWKLSVNGEEATDVKAGSTVNFVAVKQKDDDNNESENTNVKIVKSEGNNVSFDLSEYIKVGRVETGDSRMSNAGFMIKDGPNMTKGGIYAANTKITGVQKGTNENDAVNVSQLNEIKDQIADNSLVKWDEGEKLITIGAQKDGIEINVANNDDENRIISGVAVGKVSSDSTEAINGHQLFNYADNISKYLGGETDVIDGFKPTFTVQDTKHDNVTDAFAAVDASITDIYTQINNATGNSLVQWDEGEKLITIGKEKDGTKIDITGTDGGRIIAGVKDGEISESSTEAINGSQINKISGDIANFFGGNAAFENGVFVGPNYNLSTVSADGNVVQKTFYNVGEALEGLDVNIKNVNKHIQYVDNKFDKLSQDALLWNDGKQAFSAHHEKDGRKTDSKITDLLNGDISEESTDAINGSQLYAMGDKIANYFGGGASYEDGEWIEPTFIVSRRNESGDIVVKQYHNVSDAFAGVDNSITDIYNQINNVTENSLVKQEGGVSAPVTIGKDTAGTEINVAGIGKIARKISGVKAAEKGDEAVNKDQLDKSIKDITKDIETATAAAVLYDKNDDDSVNYGSVTLGGDKNNGPVALHNVKNGSISENSHDAINGSQINKISADIAKFFGGGAKFINGAFEGLKYTLSAIVEGEVGQANFYDVGSALTGLDKNVQDVNQRLTNVSNEFNQKIEGISKDALLWDEEEEAFVAHHEKDGQKTKSKLKYLLDGEIADGSTDAITGNQLYFMSNQLANYFGGGAKYENGKWTDPTFKIVQVNADGTTVEKEHHNVADAFGDVNKNMSNINNRIDDVINKVDSDALKWNDKEKAYDAGRDGKPNKIINVADGKIAEGSKDAVNGGQLWETNERVTGVEKDVKHLTNRVDNISNTIADIGDTVLNIDNKVNDIAEDAVRYDRDEDGKKTNKITLAGGDPGEPVIIDNVADGKIEKGSKEAVNGGQLHDYTKEQMKIILDESKQYTDQRVNNIVIDAIDDAVDQAKQYTDMKFDVLNYSIENVKKEARQAAAIGLAVSNLRYNDTPGKLSVGFGSGLWRSQSAFAFGAGYTSENGKYRSNISATTSGGHWGIGAGFNMTLN
ncbi:Vomp family autotransporter [Bartonella sp. OT172YNZD]|uniref:Vomp family autotransporter n=1 Tax=Bartonella sp. OT172YNZD TaxID=3243572 RepID=UPI0035D126F0